MSSILAMFSPAYALQLSKERKAARERRGKEADFVPWSSDIKWEQELNIRAETYHPMELFDVKAILPHVHAHDAKEGEYVESPKGTYRYIHRLLPRWQTLSTWYGSKIGDVMFDAPVIVPALFERDRYDETRFRRDPWMSFSPAEIISLRGGTRRAKGKVIVAGLGLGKQLLDVAARKKVKSIVLVEKSQELVDWIMPVLEPHIDKPLEVIVGDAYEELPKLEADVALVDIFLDYGNNDWERDKLRASCKDIGYIWCWGAAVIKGGLW
jgi:hypothetical protein